MQSEPSSSSSTTTPTTDRGRGRGKSRGGLGKYLRAKGRRGSGRPAEWGKRLVLDGEGEVDPEELEEIEEQRKKYSRRELGTNADRYQDEEPVLDSDGEEVVEPEVDLSAFLARQKLSPDEGIIAEPPGEEEEIDHTLDHLLTSNSQPIRQPKKGQVQSIAWDNDLEEMSRERAIAEANWELKSRFRSQAAKQRAVRPNSAPSNRGNKPVVYTEAPPLPTEQPQVKDKKEELQDFLDDLLG